MFALIGSVNSAKSLYNGKFGKLLSRSLFPSSAVQKRGNVDAIDGPNLFHGYPFVAPTLQCNFSVSRVQSITPTATSPAIFNNLAMAKILSEFHYSVTFIDGACFCSAEALHAEISFKLGLPHGYGRNWDALLDCLSSIGTNKDNLCAHWDWISGKRLVLSVRDFVDEQVDSDTFMSFSQVVAEANNRLTQRQALNRIWVEYLAPSGAHTSS